MLPSPSTHTHTHTRGFILTVMRSITMLHPIRNTFQCEIVWTWSEEHLRWTFTDANFSFLRYCYRWCRFINKVVIGFIFFFCCFHNFHIFSVSSFELNQIFIVCWIFPNYYYRFRFGFVRKICRIYLLWILWLKKLLISAK